MYGGKSPEHEVSVRSARNILAAMDPQRYEIQLIGVDYQGRWFAQQPEELNTHKAVTGQAEDQLMLVPGDAAPLRFMKNGEPLARPDVIFSIIHGPLGEDGTLQGLLRQLDIAFVGPDVCGSALAMDKDLSKKVLKACDLLVAAHLTFYDHEKDAIDFMGVANQLGLPVFVKPANMGSSVGVSKASNKAEFDEAVSKAFLYDTKIVVEEMIEGRELECAVMGNRFPETTHLGEVVMTEGFYDYDAKYEEKGTATTRIPAPGLDDPTLAKLLMVAKSAYQSLDCEGLARVDLFLCEDGRVYVNELNTLPGFTQISMYPQLWEHNGLAYPALIDRLLELAWEKHQRRTSLKVLHR